MPDESTQQTTQNLHPTSVPAPGVAAPSIAGYELLEELGRGGMGVVWKARQLSLNRIVALKMLLGGDAVDPRHLERFQAEAEAVARLQHPSIVQIFEVGEHGGRAFFSLEYVAGGTLADRLQGTPLPAREAAGLIEELANAVQYAHERNVLHRDLKPGNVLLADPTGESFRPKLTDFGLAKTLDSDVGQTRTGAIMGTPSYMAPEQAWGDSKRVGPRADIYALGAILYECLTGRPPFRGATVMETLEQVRHQEPVSPARLNPGVPRDLETICQKCLCKELTGRYATARELSLDLRRYLDGEPVSARPIGFVGRVWRAARRRPAAALAAMLTVLTLLLGVGGGLALWLYQTSESGRQLVTRLRDEAESARQEAETSQGRAEDFAGRLERVLYLQQVQAAVREWDGANIRRARELLDDCPVGQRGWEWHYARRLLHPQCEIGGLRSPVHAVAFVDNGKSLLTGGRTDGLRVWDATTGRERFYLEDTQPKGGTGGGVGFAGGAPLGVGILANRNEVVASFRAGWLDAWSLETGKKVRAVKLDADVPVCKVAVAADQSWLAYSFHGANFAAPRPPLFVVDPLTGKELGKFVEHTATAGALAASPDGKLLASGTAEGQLILWNMVTRKAEAQVQQRFDAIVALAFSPDGTRLYAALDDGVLVCWSVPRLEMAFRVGHGAYQFTSLTVRPDGAHIACGTSSGEIVFADGINGKRQRVYRGHLGSGPNITALSFSPDGTRVASVGFDGTLRLWDASQPQEHSERQIALPAGARLAANGQLLVSAHHDGTLRTWDALLARPLGQHRVGNSPLLHLALSDDANRAVVFAEDGSLHVVDRTADRVILTLPAVADRIDGLALAADGSRLFASGQAATGPFLRCWEVPSGQETLRLPPTAQTVRTLAISPDGRLLSGYTDEPLLRVWSLPGGQEVFRLRTIVSHPPPLRFSPEGGHLAAGLGEGVRVWSTDDWRETLRTRGHPFAQLAFAPDGQRLASVSDRVTVWDLRSGREALTLPGSGRLSALSWSPDGKTLFGAETDGVITSWQGAE